MSMRLGRIPPATSEAIRRSMKGNRGRNTRLELRIRGALARRGLRGYRCNLLIKRTKVDLAFPAQKVAILAHGCFWHHCPTCNLGVPKSHYAYWSRKFAINRQRDKRVAGELIREGWRVAQFWEHEVNRNVEDVVRRIQVLVASAG